MHFKLCVSSFYLFVLIHYTLSLPHPTCQYDPPVLSCKEYNLEIPNNFDVNAIPEDVGLLTLDCPRDNQTDGHCNVMQRNARPFPQLPYLRAVSLYGFKGVDGHRFPVNVLLSNVKSNIESLDVRYSKIGRLDGEYLKGFSALRELIMGGNDITEVAPDTFQLLSSSPPVLREVHLGHNRIVMLDWGVWQPVANSLTDIGLANQNPGLRSLYLRPRTQTFSLNKLNKLTINNNRQHYIPRQILDTMTTFQDDEQQFILDGNPFCPTHPDCSCNEMKSFFNWVVSVQRTANPGVQTEFIVTCGAGDRACKHRLALERSAFTYAVGRKGSDTLQVAPFEGGQKFTDCDTIEPIYAAAVPYPAGESDPASSLPSGEPYVNPEKDTFPGGHLQPTGPMLPVGPFRPGGPFFSGPGSSSAPGANNVGADILPKLAAVLPAAVAAVYPADVYSNIVMPVYTTVKPFSAGEFDPTGSLPSGEPYPDHVAFPEDRFLTGGHVPRFKSFPHEGASHPGFGPFFSGSGANHPAVGILSKLAAVLPAAVAAIYPAELYSDLMFEKDSLTGMEPTETVPSGTVYDRCMERCMSFATLTSVTPTERPVTSEIFTATQASVTTKAATTAGEEIVGSTVSETHVIATAATVGASTSETIGETVGTSVEVTTAAVTEFETNAPDNEQTTEAVTTATGPTIEEVLNAAENTTEETREGAAAASFPSDPDKNWPIGAG